jgi:hypothetical protein
MKRLHGKRILFIAPPFFGYHIDVIAEFESRGAIVDWLPDRPFDSPAAKAITRLFPSWVLPAANRLYSHLLSRFGASRYDFIFVINGQTLSCRFIQLLRTSYPAARFILYMWDSVANRKHVQRNFCLFDRVLSFDPRDVAAFGLQLRPLFFGSGFTAPLIAEPSLYHISFIGTVHSDRFNVVDCLRSRLSDGIHAYWYLYLQAPWVLSVYRCLKPQMRSAKASDFKFVPLDKATVHYVFSRSRVILDIAHPRQAGLTMRTFETLGSNKKLVTTNAAVRDYDFYQEANVCVVDRSAPIVSTDFLEAPFELLSPAVSHRYSISGWLDEVLGFQESF